MVQDLFAALSQKNFALQSDKSQWMATPAFDGTETELELADGSCVPRVWEMQVLGSVVAVANAEEVAMNFRLARAWACYFIHQRLFCKKSVH